jgi:hypothetical protein
MNATAILLNARTVKENDGGKVCIHFLAPRPVYVRNGRIAGGVQYF